MKTSSYWYRDSYYKPETGQAEVYNGDSYTRKTVPSHWLEALVNAMLSIDELWLD